MSELHAHSHEATRKINAQEDDYLRAGSEIETGARDCIGLTFLVIANAYGFEDADVEELIAPRTW